MKNKDQILEILKSSEGHLTAEEMYIHCQNNGVKISMATTYRILGRLAEERQIRKVSIPGQPDIFDKTLTEHEHLVCAICGKVKDIKLNDFKNMIIKEIDEEIESYDLCIKYICPKCRNKIKKEI